MSEHPHATTVRRLYDAINAGDDATIHAIFAPDMVRHDLSGMIPHSDGSDAVTDFLGTLKRAMPDLYMQVNDVFANDDGRAAAQATLTGTHQGDFLGAPASGRRVTFEALTVYRFEGHRLAEAWSLVDWAGAVKQMTERA